ITRLIASCLNSFENDLRIFSSQLSVYYPLTGCVHPLDHVKGHFKNKNTTFYCHDNNIWEDG
ncbi:hypothetical protein SDB51_12655, partial [Legionella pneumophila serogroup 1]